MCPAPTQVESSVERGWLLVPRPLNERNSGGRDSELRVTFAIDHMLCGGEAHGLKLVARGFESVDLGSGELVRRRLIPVGPGRHGSGRVEGKALLLDDLLPLGAWAERDALHEAPKLLVRRQEKGSRLARISSSYKSFGYRSHG